MEHRLNMEIFADVTSDNKITIVVAAIVIILFPNEKLYNKKKNCFR